MVARGILTRVGGVAAALLPSRYWNAFERRVPVGASAVLSGCITCVAGGLLGTFGFLAYAARQASALNELTLQLATQQLTQAPGGQEVSSTSAMFGNIFAGFGFLFFTPLGWLSGYLTTSGAVRAIAAHVDDPVGDPILTGIDLAARTTAAAAAHRKATRHRLALEGVEIPDRMVSGRIAGLPDADLVIVSSRRKDGWTAGLVVMMPEKWYRLGEPVERTVEGHLRTLYPLKEHNDLEVARRSVPYDPPSAFNTARR